MFISQNGINMESQINSIILPKITSWVLQCSLVRLMSTTVRMSRALARGKEKVVQKPVWEHANKTPTSFDALPLKSSSMFWGNLQCTVVYAPLFSRKELVVFNVRSVTQTVVYGLKRLLLYFSACCCYSWAVTILKHMPTLCLWKSMEVWPLTLTELEQICRSAAPTPFLNKWAFYRIMVLERIDWPQLGCTLPSLENVKPVMGWTQRGCD